MVLALEPYACTHKESHSLKLEFSYLLLGESGSRDWWNHWRDAERTKGEVMGEPSGTHSVFIFWLGNHWRDTQEILESGKIEKHCVFV